MIRVEFINFTNGAAQLVIALIKQEIPNAKENIFCEIMPVRSGGELSGNPYVEVSGPDLDTAKEFALKIKPFVLDKIYISELVEI